MSAGLDRAAPLHQWGLRLRGALAAADADEIALCRTLKIDPSSLNRWKRSQPIALAHALALAQRLDVTLDWLFMGRPNGSMGTLPVAQYGDADAQYPIDPDVMVTPVHTHAVECPEPCETPLCLVEQGHSAPPLPKPTVTASDASALGARPMHDTRQDALAFESKLNLWLRYCEEPPYSLPVRSAPAPADSQSKETQSMSTSYEIDITMSANTVQTLKQQGCSLLAFKAVKTQVTNGAPTVWVSVANYLTSTSLVWEETYSAYISAQQIKNNVNINTNTNIAADLGYNVLVDQYGNLTANQNGAAGTISIINQAATPYTTGISQASDNGGMQPLCALPLNGNFMDQVTPIEKVMLVFSSGITNTGTVLYSISSTGFMIDLTGVSDRSVVFDVNTGWSANGASWAQVIPANTALSPLLVTNG